MLNVFKLFCALLVFLVTQNLLATENTPHLQFGWEKLEDSEGITLFRATTETEGLLPFKAVATLDTPYEQLVMALVDAERKPSWAPKLKATRIHNTLSPNSFEYSEYYTTPWPFKDREFLLSGTVSYTENKVVFSAVDCQTLSFASDDHLKANINILTFVITPITATSSHVEFTFSGDMGGWIPDFVKTIIQKRWPVRFIQSLSEHIKGNHDLETIRYQLLNKMQLSVPASTNG